MHIKTPLIHSSSFSSQSGLEVQLKLENLQPVQSFKIRGIGHICNELYKTGARHFVSSSGGNAGYAVAYAGKQLGVRVSVFVPKSTSQIAIEKLKSLDAEVIQIGADWDETNRHALDFAQEYQAQYISPFDHPLIWEGHSTLVDELIEQSSKPDAIILSVGGGGLLCGVIQGLHKNSWQNIPVIAVETEGTASLTSSIKANQLTTLNSISGIATSLGSRTVAKEAFAWTKRHDIRSLVVSDDEALSACLDFKEVHDYLVEPACGASLAALKHPEIFKGMKSVIVIVCGGINTSIVENALK